MTPRDFYEYPSLPEDENYFDLLERSEDAAASQADDDNDEQRANDKADQDE